ncbi:MAG: hypothetical protein EBS31_00415 [Burkholderiaceae bacterium]|nr:hypothetical protein [Burkholderiaceae bacterium]
MTEMIGHYQEDKIKSLFIGRKVVKAEGSELTLDDGTILQIIPNDGGCSCGAGDYYLDNINKFDNVITNVEVRDTTGEAGTWDEDAHTYQLFVYSGGISTSVADIKGDDGNGYYGTGFEIYVKYRPGPPKPRP